MRKPSMYRDEAANFVLCDENGTLRTLGKDGKRAGEALAAARARYKERYRVFLVYSRTGLVTLGFGVSAHSVMRRSEPAFAYATCGPWETHWKARARMRRVLGSKAARGAYRARIDTQEWFELTPHLSAELRKESVYLSGPDVRKVRAGRL